MAATEYPLVSSWNASARFTAAAETGINLVNPLDFHKSGQVVCYTTTMSDTPPTVPVARAAFIRPGDGPKALTLVAGERLWMARYDRATGSATIEA